MSNKTPDPMAVEEVAIRAAMSRRLNELKASAAALADPRPWIKDRPLTCCLVAAGAGTALGMLAAGRKPAPPEHTATDGNGHVPPHHREHQTLGALLAASLIPSLKPLVHDLVHSAMGGLAGGPAGTADSGKTADVAEESMPSGLAEDNRVVD